MLRAALRTEPNVRLAVLFGSMAKGDDHEDSDIDVLVVLDNPSIGRLMALAERLSRRLGRDVQLVRLADAEDSPVLMVDVIEQGRVLIDREGGWPGLRGHDRRVAAARPSRGKVVAGAAGRARA